MNRHTKFTIEGFIVQANNVHGYRYDYSLLTTASLGVKHNIICKKHGIFYQYGYHHISGHGCKLCGIENRSGKNSVSHARRKYIEADLGSKFHRECEMHGKYFVSFHQFEKGATYCVKCKNDINDINIATFKDYNRKVRHISNFYYKKYPFMIDSNPDLKPRGRYTFHLDHIFSIKDGFNAQLDQKIVGHYSNLMLIPAIQNIYKSNKSLRTVDSAIYYYNLCIENFGH